MTGVMMTMRGSRIARAVAAALAGSCGFVSAPQLARAQEVEQPPSVIEEVVVTAQRREQALQDVPISLQVVGADLINDTAAEDMNDLNGFVPGLVVSGDSPTQPKYSLRGVSTGDFGVGTDPAVGVYVDGIYSARSGSSMLAFNDIERIEILKGPQGTLLGRNSAAGAVSIVTRQPVLNEFDGNLRIRVGEYQKRYVDGMVNVPIGDRVALRVVGAYNASDGWIEDAATRRNLNPEDNWATRAALRWEIADGASATLSWDHDELNQLARPAIGLVPVADGQTSVPYPADPDTYLDPLRAPVKNDVIGNDESRDFDRVNLFVDFDFGWAQLRSSTSWSQFDTNNLEDEDGTNLKPYVYFDTANIEHNESWYQEFKLSHSDERFDWVAGASYYSEDARQTSATHTFTDSVDTVLRNLGKAPTPDGTLFGFTSGYLESLGIPLTMLGYEWQEDMYNEGNYSATAVFGDVIWHATDRTNLTLGLRYTSDDKHFSWLNGPRVAPELDATLAALQAGGFFEQWPIPIEAYQFDLVFANNPAIEGQKVKAHDTWNDLSPRFVVDYELADDVMVWGSVAKGYKAGGYNSVEIGSIFDPEDVWNVETGVKSVFPSLNLLVNTSVYYYIYKDKQAITLVGETESGIPQYLIDTSDEQAYGLDLESRWQPVEQLVFSANLALIDATYKDKTTREGVDLSGDPTGEPYVSASVGGDWILDFAEQGHTDLSVQWGYRGPTRCNDNATLQGTCQVSPNFKVGEAQNRVDVRLAWSSEDNRLGAAAFVTNVFDDQYVTGVNNLTKATFGTPFASISEPRQWGLEMRYGF